MVPPPPRTPDEPRFRDLAGPVEPSATKPRLAPQARDRPPSVRPRPSFWVDFDEHGVEALRVDGGREVRRLLSSVPEATLDLHGEREDSAQRALTEFLVHSRRRGRRVVLVVVGKGNRSPGRVGWLRFAVVDWIADGPLAHAVQALRTAPRERGGQGALVLVLAPRTAR